MLKSTRKKLQYLENRASRLEASIMESAKLIVDQGVQIRELAEFVEQLARSNSELSRKLYMEMNIDNGFYFFRQIRGMKSIIYIRLFDIDGIYTDIELVDLPSEDPSYSISYTIMTEGLDYKKTMIIKVRDNDEEEDNIVYINYTNIYDVSDEVCTMEPSEYDLIPAEFEKLVAKDYQIENISFIDKISGRLI